MSPPAGAKSLTNSGSADGPGAPPGSLHVAIIMDGNGRWAKARGLPRTLGHRSGVNALKRTVEAAADLGIDRPRPTNAFLKTGKLVCFGVPNLAGASVPEPDIP